ncbi:MAG: orotidine-5'-phosphate decarboxylase [Acidobacteriota bacterium]
MDARGTEAEGIEARGSSQGHRDGTGAEPPTSPTFADALTLRIRALGHPLCVGLDPHLHLLPPLFRRGSMEPGDPETAAAVGEFLTAILDRLEGRVAVIKPQIAFFEQLGWRGLEVLETLVASARRRGLLVLMDAKRGDIGSTAAAYADAFFGERAPLQVDALTLNPYLGLDSLAPFLERAQDHRGGLFVLVKTSNAGAGDFQDLRVEGGDAVHLALADALAPLAASSRGPVTGWSAVGAVVGATWPAQAEAIRERLPHSLFLVPGYGAQGGAAKDAVRAFIDGPGGRREGGIVNSSRGILFPEGSVTDDAGAWGRAIEAALDRATSELGEATT